MIALYDGGESEPRLDLVVGFPWRPKASLFYPTSQTDDSQGIEPRGDFAEHWIKSQKVLTC